LLDKDYEYEQHRRQHYHHCTRSPYQQIYSPETTAVFNSRHACALSDGHRQPEAAALLLDAQTDATSKQADEATATQQGEYQLSSRVTCSAADPDITRVQAAQA